MAAKGKFAQPFTDYEILERLGSGGMGTVFKARYRGQANNPSAPTLVPGQIVALKVLRPSLGRNQRYRERLRREAELSMRLEHENLVKGYMLGEEAGYHYLVMEFCEGPSLRHLLRMWGCFPEDLVVDVGIQIAAALSHAHEHGIVHRDIKPANILVDDDGRAVLTDLGLAKGETDLALTSDGATVGTPQYMSPEQAMNPIDVDVRSDLYSLGATLYHMSTGSAPFDGQSVGHVILKILRQRARPANEVNPELSPGLSLVLRKLLEKDIEVRYQRATHLLADLQRLRRGEDPKVDVKALERAEGRQKRRRLRQRAPLVMLGVLMLLLTVVLFKQFGGTEKTGPEPISDIVKLRELVERYIRKGGRQYRSAFEVVDSFEPDGPSEAASKQNLASYLRSKFESSLTDFLSRFDQKMFEYWFLTQPSKQESWDTSFLGIYVPTQLVSQYGYAPEALPAGRAIFANWQQQRRQRFAQIVRGYGQKLVAEYAAAFERVEMPKIATLVREGRFDDASQRLAKLAADPGLCEPNPKSKLKRLLSTQQPLVTRLTDAISEERKNVLDAAKQAVDDWQNRVRGRLDLASAHAARSEFEKATRRLDAAQKILDSPPAGLPARVHVPRELLARELTKARSHLQTAIYNSDLASLKHLEDVTHTLLFQLDVDGARDLLTRNSLYNQEIAARLKQLANDVETFDKTLDWIVATLRSRGGKAKVWRRHTGMASIHGRLTKIERSPEPVVVISQAGLDQTYPLTELDRVDIVNKLRAWDPKGVETRREGLALFLYFGDNFDAATKLMPPSRPDTEFSERRDRRRQRLADEREGEERVITTQIASAQQFLDANNFEFAQRIVDQLISAHRGSHAFAAFQQRVAAIEQRLEFERVKRELVARLPDNVRRDIDLGLSPRGDGTALLGLRFDFRDPDKFVDRLGPHWQKTSEGIRRAIAPDPARELKDPISLSLPVFDEKQEAELILDFHIPADGRRLDVLQIAYQGTRVLFYQVPGLADRPGRCLFVDSGRVKKAIERDLMATRRESKDAPVWYFMRGGKYQLRLRLEKLELSNRVLTVELNGQRLIKQKVKGRQPAPETLSLLVVGGIVLEQLELNGSPRQ